MIRIRVDDFPNTKGEPQHTLAAFKDFDKTLRTYMGAKRYLLGVIPKRCTPEDLVYLRNETDCVIGMHGTDHDEARLDRNSGNQFEPYMTAALISRELGENKRALELAVGRPIMIYMPPRNVIDGKTISVLARHFDRFTSGPETDMGILKNTMGVHIHSQPPHEYGRTDELYARRSYMELNQRVQQDHDVVLTLHWTWETNIGLDHLKRFMEQIHTNLGSF